MPELRTLVAEELAMPVDPRVRSIGRAIAARHGKASRAVLFYGSCLREKQLDGLMLDFYLIVSDYRAAYDKGWLAAANRLIPPNVFYFEHDGLAAKYAVLSEADFHRLNGPETRSVSVWARFAQPSRLVWAANKAARERRVAAVSRAAPTLLAAAGPVAGEDALDRWRRAFALTYSSELRAERKGRAASVVDLDPQRYARFTEPALKAANGAEAEGQLGAAADRREGAFRLAPRQGEPDLRRGRGLHRVEDQPPRRDGHQVEAVAAAPPAARRDQPLAAPAEVRGGSLAERESAAATALARAPTVNGLRRSSWVRRSSLSPSPT